MQLSSYEFEIFSLCYESPFAYAKDLLTGVRNNHKICTFFCYSNHHQMLSNFVWPLIYFIKSGPCVQSFKNIFLHACIETFLHDWLKWFQMCLMTKIVHNLSSWLKKGCTFDSNVKHDVRKSIIYYVLGHIWPQIWYLVIIQLEKLF
jgi:hypothetical protein